jgi:hypothetical protein
LSFKLEVKIYEGVFETRRKWRQIDAAQTCIPSDLRV